MTTTSDQIRSLAKEGLTRSEIAKRLGIRYQHVRNVLIGSGITSGLKRNVQAVREPIEVIESPPPREDTLWSVLRDSGFQYLGEWSLSANGVIKLDCKPPTDPGVYAFVVDDMVVYVGITLNGLNKRMDQYKVGHQKQKTSSRIKTLIIEALHSGKTVKVLTATPEPSEWRDLPVNTAAGLEVGLIEMIRPVWNRRGLNISKATKAT